MQAGNELVAVLGAGSTGASTAYHLARSKQRVLLLDSGGIASGMTGKSTALVRTHYSNEIVAKMALYSLRLLRDFGEIGNSGFVGNGMLVIASKDQRGAIEQNLAMLKNAGVNTESVDGTEYSKRFTEVSFDDVDYAVLEPESGYADPVATTTSFAMKAKELGASLELGRHVQSLEARNGKLSALIFQDGGRLACSKAILCTNVWTNKLLARSGIPSEKLLPLWAAPHPVVVLRRPEIYQGSRVIVADLIRMTYYKPEGRSLLFAGSLDPELDGGRCDPDNPPSDVTFEQKEKFSEAAASRLLPMSRGMLHSAYVGMYDMTPDQHPILDELSEIGLEGVYCCVGLSGHGFKLCPALGLMNAEMILAREGIFDRSHFSLSRFKTGRLLTSKYAVGTIA
jgi:sarcosine oxidase, subunit beta